jgi:RecB family exonuclease
MATNLVGLLAQGQNPQLAALLGAPRGTPLQLHATQGQQPQVPDVSVLTPQVPAAPPQPEMQQLPDMRQVTPQASRYFDVSPPVPASVEEKAGIPAQGIMERVFVGERPQGLSDSDYESVKRNAFLHAGLAMMMSDAQPGYAPSFGATVAQGILMARQTAAEMSGNIAAEQARQQRLQSYSQVFEEFDPGSREAWERIARLAVAAEDLDTAKTARELLSEMPEHEQAEWTLENVNAAGENHTFAVERHADGSITLRDPFTGEPVSEAPTPAPEKPVLQRGVYLGNGMEADLITDQYFNPIGMLGEARPADPNRGLQVANLGLSFSSEARSQHMQTGTQEAARAVNQLDAFMSRITDPETGRVSVPDDFIDSVEAEAIATSFQALLSPGVIREPRLQAIMGSGGAVSRARSALGDLARGGTVDAAAVKSIMDVYPSLKQAAIEQSDDITRRFRSQAMGAGVSPEYVNDPFAGHARRQPGVAGNPEAEALRLLRGGG